MRDSELDAIGVSDPLTRTAYKRCGELLSEDAAQRSTPMTVRYLLPPETRPYMEVFFVLITHVDDIVDRRERSVQVRHHRMDEWMAAYQAAVDGTLAAPGTFASQDEEDDAAVARAFVHLMRTWDLPLAEVPAYLEWQRRTLSITGYKTREEVQEFIDCVSLAPTLWSNRILGNESEAADQTCRDATNAFQLIDFVLDLPEDLEAGCLYVPLEVLDEYGLDRDAVEEQVRTGRISSGLRRLVAGEAARARDYFERARNWPRMLPPRHRAFAEWEVTLNEMKLRELESGDCRHLRPGYRPDAAFRMRAVARTYGLIARAIRVNRFTDSSKGVKPCNRP